MHVTWFLINTWIELNHLDQMICFTNLGEFKSSIEVYEKVILSSMRLNFQREIFFCYFEMKLRTISVYTFWKNNFRMESWNFTELQSKILLFDLKISLQAKRSKSKQWVRLRAYFNANYTNCYNLSKLWWFLS